MRFLTGMVYRMQKSVILSVRAAVLQGGWPLFLHRMGVALMDKKSFDFKDLMAFGMFILALLTFVFVSIK